MSKTRPLRGYVFLLCAALGWGVGNAVTGITAAKYALTTPVLAAVDIALANTLGGLTFLGGLVVIWRKSTPSGGRADSNVNLLDVKTLVSGALKGLNTCLFVLSVTYIVATKSLVLESTYVLWAVLLSVLFSTRSIPVLATSSKALLLCIGAFLVSGTAGTNEGSQPVTGIVFGLSAGLSYAGYLLIWSRVTEVLKDTLGQLRSTAKLLVVSAVTIVLVTEGFVGISTGFPWIPLGTLGSRDVYLQTANGVLVIGVVYLFITIGMGNLKDAAEGASVIAAFCLSLSIPITLLVEWAIGKFAPSLVQLLGGVLFIVAFVSMSVTVRRVRESRTENE